MSRILTKTQEQLKSDLRGIETKIYHKRLGKFGELKSDLRGIETKIYHKRLGKFGELKSDLRGIETTYMLLFLCLRCRVKIRP